MIGTSTQLKAKIRNISGGDSAKAQTLIRNYVMERFLERIALSKYRNNFILKGGMLVSSVVGLDSRATQDIDTTVKSLSLSREDAEKVVSEIAGMELSDNIIFRITKVEDILSEHDYPGIRFHLEAQLDKLKQAVKIDISTDDVITSGAIDYDYKLMFEDRSISLWTYNLETMLGEKLETAMARNLANTRMRDFYDVYVLTSTKKFDPVVLKRAFFATSRKRGTEKLVSELIPILDQIKQDEGMHRLWNNYMEDSYFVKDLTWADVVESMKRLALQVV